MSGDELISREQTDDSTLLHLESIHTFKTDTLWQISKQHPSIESLLHPANHVFPALRLKIRTHATFHLLIEM